MMLWVAALALAQEAPVATQTALAVRFAPIVTLAATSRNLSCGGNMRVGRPTGPMFSASLSGDWFLSGLVSGFLLDDAASPRFTASQVAGWTFRWPGKGERSPWVPRIGLGLGVWEVAEVDSLAQSFRTEDYGVYAALSTGGQVSVIWPSVSVGFALRPVGTSVWVHGDHTFPTAFQLGNVVLDIDVTVDLGRPGKRPADP